MINLAAILTVIVSIAGIVLTLINVRLVYDTLREMRNQRVAAQRPDLVIPKLTVYGHADGKVVRQLPIGRVWKNTKHTHLGGADVEVKLYNVGFGVAKNIELSWIEDCGRTMQQIIAYCAQNEVPIELQPTENKVVIKELGSYVTATYGLPDFPLTANFDFLMPVSITKEGVTVSTPHMLKEIISIVMFLRGHRAQLSHASDLLEIDMPSITLKVHFDDGEGNRYAKELAVEFIPRRIIRQSLAAGRAGLMWVGFFEFKDQPIR